MLCFLFCINLYSCLLLITSYVSFNLSLFAAIRNILAVQNHGVQNQALHVAAFHGSVGLLPPYHDTTMPGGWIPENVSVTGLNARLLNFISTSRTCQQLVDDKMADVAADVEWDSYSDTSRSVELTCTITHNMKNAQHRAKTWSHDAPKIFMDVLNREFASEDINIPQQGWRTFVGRTGYVTGLDPSRVHVDVDENANVMHISGHRNDVENVFTRVKHDHIHVQEEMTRAATFVTEAQSGLALHNLRMLMAKAFKSGQENKFQDMTVVIDMKHQEVRFTGMPQDVKSAKVAMFDILNAMREKSVVMSGLLISLINGTTMKKYFVEKFKSQHICAVFDNNMESETLKVYALSDQDLKVAVETIKIGAGECTFPADLANMSVREKWRELVTKLQSEHNGLLAVTENEDSVTVAGATTPYEEALNEVVGFLADNSKTETFVDLEHGVADYMDNYTKEEVSKVMKANPRVSVTMKTDGHGGFAVKAYGDRHQQVIQQLQTMAKDVKTGQLVVDKPGMVQPTENDIGMSSQRGAKEGRSINWSGEGGLFGSRVDLPGGVSVEVVHGDLTTFQADAIVSAANERLDLYGGLAKAIADAGIVYICNEENIAHLIFTNC